MFLIEIFNVAEENCQQACFKSFEQMFVTVTLPPRSTEHKYECSQSKLNNLFEQIFIGQ